MQLEWLYSRQGEGIGFNGIRVQGLDATLLKGTEHSGLLEWSVMYLSVHGHSINVTSSQFLSLT